MMPFTSLFQALMLALSDMRREPMAFLVGVAAIAAVLAPVLVLFGLKFGIVSAMTERLANNPNIRAIYPLGQARYTLEQLQDIRQWSETGFLVPKTRYLAAEAYLRVQQENASDDQVPGTRVELIPTAPGDPLIPQFSTDTVDTDRPGLVLSQRAAEHLAVKDGQMVIMELGRKRGGQQQFVELEFQVLAVLPLQAHSRIAAFVRLPILEAAEDYRSGIAVAQWGWSGDPPPDTPRTYSGFRLYARDLDTIAPLRQRLLQMGIEVDTHLAQVQLVQAIDRNLSFLFYVVAGLAVAAGGFSVALGQWNLVLRKHRALSLLRLLGHGNFTLAVFPAIQGLCSALVASLVALGIYTLVAPWMNQRFAHQIQAGEQVCRLLPEHAFLAVVFTLSLTLLASLAAGMRAWRIGPSEGLRYE